MTTFQGRFSGRAAIVTGGASGLRREVAARIIAEGGQVSLWDVNAEALEAARIETGATHSRAIDVSDHAAVAHAAAESVAALGRIDILVCSAGITGATAAVQDYPIDSWRRVFDINVNGLFYCCRAVVPHMVAAGYGRIINVASVAGKEGNPNASAYSASKAAVIGFTKSLGKELAATKVRVNCVTPAAAATDIFKQMTEAQIAYMLSKIPAGRFAQVEEIAALACWLGTEECSFSTGGVFDVSGGRATY